LHDPRNGQAGGGSRYGGQKKKNVDLGPSPLEVVGGVSVKLT